MSPSDPEKIESILEGLKKTTALGRSLRQALIWERWPDIAGPKMAPHGRPRDIRDGTLRIEVDSAVWMNTYAYRKTGLIRRINKMAGEKLVDDIFVVLAEEAFGDALE